jgi:hypothetical protein
LPGPRLVKRKTTLVIRTALKVQGPDGIVKFIKSIDPIQFVSIRFSSFCFAPGAREKANAETGHGSKNFAKTGVFRRCLSCEVYLK